LNLGNRTKTEKKCRGGDQALSRVKEVREATTGCPREYSTQGGARAWRRIDSDLGSGYMQSRGRFAIIKGKNRGGGFFQRTVLKMQKPGEDNRYPEKIIKGGVERAL